MASFPTPWEAPEYTEIRLRPGYVDYQCGRCGVFVADIIAHNRHHKALDQLVEGLANLTKVVIPGIPEGVILSELLAHESLPAELLSRETHGEGEG